MRLTIAVLSAALLLTACGRLAPAAAPKAPAAMKAQAKRDGGTHLPIGAAAPDMVLTNLDGTEVPFSAKGRPTLLAFWATWCPTCTNELPHLEAIHVDFEPQGLRMLCVNATREKLTKIADLWKWQMYTMPVFGQFTQAPKELYLINSIPTLYWIDESGTIVDVQVGPDEPASLRARTAKLLAGK